MVVNAVTVTFADAVTQVGMPQANLTAQPLGLGAATTDNYNRLPVNAPAVLLNDAGTGREATVTKTAPANDVLFAFKTNWSARARIGLLSSDDFSFKVSPDGLAFYEALWIDRATGRVKMPEPIVLAAARSSRPAARRRPVLRHVAPDPAGDVVPPHLPTGPQICRCSATKSTVVSLPAQDRRSTIVLVQWRKLASPVFKMSRALEDDRNAPRQVGCTRSRSHRNRTSCAATFPPVETSAWRFTKLPSPSHRQS